MPEIIRLIILLICDKNFLISVINFKGRRLVFLKRYFAAAKERFAALKKRFITA
ncbi:MAG: hypothetical protein J6P44_01065 [Bacteroidales bacterium]|nr:hypothetical protein [Bacteroidales bacterium]